MRKLIVLWAITGFAGVALAQFPTANPGAQGTVIRFDGLYVSPEMSARFPQPGQRANQMLRLHSYYRFYQDGVVDRQNWGSYGNVTIESLCQDLWRRWNKLQHVSKGNYTVTGTGRIIELAFKISSYKLQGAISEYGVITLNTRDGSTLKTGETLTFFPFPFVAGAPTGEPVPTPTPPPVASPPTSAPLSPLAAPLSTDESRKAAQLVNDYHNSLVFFEGQGGQGSGFIADYKGQKFLFSNAHVIAGIKGAVFKLLDRTPVTVGAGSVAIGHDIVILGVISGGTAIPMAKTLDKEVAIGDPVVVLGNAEGAQVVNTLEGRIVGIGADRVEVNAPFMHGNSGSPIIHLPSGKVIGIATYCRLKENLSNAQVALGEGKVRRFGYRLDSVQQWQPVDWKRFYAEADATKRMENTTERLKELLKLLYSAGGSTKNRGMPPAIGSTLDHFRRTSQSQADVDALLLSLCPTYANEMREGAQFTYDYFRNNEFEFPMQKQIRNAIGDHFRKLLTPESDRTSGSGRRYR